MGRCKWNGNKHRHTHSRSTIVRLQCSHPKGPPTKMSNAVRTARGEHVIVSSGYSGTTFVSGPWGLSNKQYVCLFTGSHSSLWDVFIVKSKLNALLSQYGHLYWQWNDPGVSGLFKMHSHFIVVVITWLITNNAYLQVLQILLAPSCSSSFCAIGARLAGSVCWGAPRAFTGNTETEYLFIN